MSGTMGSRETSWVEFPKLSPAGKELMETVAALMDRELGDALKASATAADVRSFQGGNGEGSVTLRAGLEGSKVRRLLLLDRNCMVLGSGGGMTQFFSCF